MFTLPAAKVAPPDTWAHSARRLALLHQHSFEGEIVWKTGSQTAESLLCFTFYWFFKFATRNIFTAKEPHQSINRALFVECNIKFKGISECFAQSKADQLINSERAWCEWQWPEGKKTKQTPAVGRNPEQTRFGRSGQITTHYAKFPFCDGHLCLPGNQTWSTSTSFACYTAQRVRAGNTQFPFWNVTKPGRFSFPPSENSLFLCHSD